MFSLSAIREIALPNQEIKRERGNEDFIVNIRVLALLLTTRGERGRFHLLLFY